MAAPSMSDIARRVGVSRTAVSFVLNGKARTKGISRDVEKRVQRMARELGYQPSRVARSLAGRRSMTVGLLLPHMNVTYCPPLAERIEHAAQAHEYQVILSHHSEEPSRFVAALHAMAGWKVDGIIAVPLLPFHVDQAIDELKQLKVPLVCVEREIEGMSFDHVNADVAEAVRMSVRRLLDLGHRRIALIDADRQLVETRYRETAFRQMVDDAGLSPETCRTVCCDGPMDSDALRDIARELLEVGARPTAIVAISAQRAVAVYEACEALGLTIPRDLSVVAITGQQFDNFHKMRFSCARLRYEEMGQAAFGILLDRFANPGGAPRRVQIAPQWVDGESLAAPGISPGSS